MVDNTGSHLTVVLPDLQTSEGELNETQLAQVSGGIGWCVGIGDDYTIVGK
ncbi:bacteriocin [Aneurinibacillus migulanus]|uniref:bacteriocin n=1 Tax=Aneurinibacillus migulanus TaxID=47500 RepID=UPI000A842A42|nr:bacteriocin [Aneurinibacillus migulanus]MED0894473.1 bacteriocin [Aneurinibacillus migulanus]MED1617083.1 bacteriocin [Aneurinibacillus migulanus]GED17281.1 hypothetical protein AMI01nite_52720 [Aneurinibacillus migulanus]